MSRAMALSVRAYAVLLRVYPLEIRGRWGPDMMEAFSLDMQAACERPGAASVCRIWCISLAEALRIALPLQLSRPCVLLPMVSAAGAAALFSGLIWALQNSIALNALVRNSLQTLGG